MRFILDIKLLDIIEPEVYRKLAVPVELSFHHLHLMIQAAMGWEHQHLYSFQESLVVRNYFKVVSPYVEEFGINGMKAPAKNILLEYLNQFHLDEKPIRNKLYYEYDFGDHWMHEIDVVDLDNSNQTSAELLEAGANCPPENCGGVPGFLRLKDYLAGRITKQEYYDWFSAVNAEGFDSHTFDRLRLDNRVKNWRMMEDFQQLNNLS